MIGCFDGSALGDGKFASLPGRWNYSPMTVHGNRRTLHYILVIIKSLNHQKNDPSTDLWTLPITREGMCATSCPDSNEPNPPFVTGQPPCRTGASTQLAAALTQHARNADTTPLVRACIQEQSQRMPIRGAACSFARGTSRLGPCYNRAPHPPLVCHARRRAPPQGPAVALIIAAPPLFRQTLTSFTTSALLLLWHSAFRF